MNNNRKLYPLARQRITDFSGLYSFLFPACQLPPTDTRNLVVVVLVVIVDYCKNTKLRKFRSDKIVVRVPVRLFLLVPTGYYSRTTVPLPVILITCSWIECDAAVSPDEFSWTWSSMFYCYSEGMRFNDKE